MPTYEYKCPKCGRKESIYIHRVGFKPKRARCGNCPSVMYPIISLSNFHLKGTGFYKTDYKDKGK